MLGASRAARLLPPVAVVGGTALSVLAGAFGWRLACAVFVVLGVLGETGLTTGNRLATLLRTRVEVGLPLFAGVRFAAVVAVSRAGDAPPSVTTAVTLVAGAVLALLSLCSLLRLRMVYRRTPSILTRNVRLDELRIPDAPPRAVARENGWLTAVLQLLVLVPSALATSPVPVLVAGGLAVAGTLVLALVLEGTSRAIGMRLGHASMVRHVSRFLDEHRPRVVLYSSGTPDTAYQVNMWLATLERLNQPAAVVLRDPELLDRLGRTSAPVLCVEYASNLMALDLSSVRAGLFTANVGNNIHLLREAGLMSSFIGHGDSDKNASFNPIVKGYDEVWVAGPVGRERYRRADVGVRDDAVVEVGRPQLDVLERPKGRPDDWVPTVLYAPTWEGWNAQQEYGSLKTIGPLLVQAVLDSRTPVRLIYRPHPSTGLRDPGMRAAHRRITELLEAANRRRGLVVPPLPTRRAVRPLAGDAAQQARDARPGYGPSAVEAEATAAREDAEWLAGCPRGAHLVVPPAGASLYACFEQADLLVADVSSVISDFLATDRPYAVCNPTAWDAAEFVRTFPTAGAGLVVDRDGDGLRQALSVAVGAEPDPYAAARRAMTDRLLGSVRGRATERFAEAVESLAARAEERVARRRLDVSAEASPKSAGQASLAPSARSLATDPTAPQ